MAQTLEQVIARTAQRLRETSNREFDDALLKHILTSSTAPPPSRSISHVSLRGRRATGARFDIKKAIAVAAAFALSLGVDGVLPLAGAVLVLLLEGLRVRQPMAELHAGILLCLSQQSPLDAKRLTECVQRYVSDATEAAVGAALLDLEAIGATVRELDAYKLAEYVSLDLAWPSVLQ